MSIPQKLFSAFRSDSTQGKVMRNVVWAVTGKVVTLLSTLLVGILVARYLGPEQYGLMNYVISVVALFGVFSTFGMNEIIIRDLARRDLPRGVIMGTAFRLRLALAGVTVLAIVVYLLLSGEDRATCVMIFVYSSSLFFTCSEVIRHYFTSIVENKYVVLSEIFRTLVGAGVKVVLLLLHAPLWAFIVALAFDAFLLAGGYVMAYRKRVGPPRDWSFSWAFGRRLLATSFPVLISSAAVIVYQRIDQVMISHMLDNEQLGYFSTAASFVGLAAFIPSIMVQTVSPILVRCRKESEQRYRQMAQRAMNLTTWSTLLVSCVISLLSFYIIRYTYGTAYLAAVPAMHILAFKAVGLALTDTGGQLTIIENIHQVAFLRNLMSCVVCVVCNYFFLPRWGIEGSAWATIVTVMFTGGLANLFIPRYHHIFRMQMRAIFLGWKDLYKLKSYIP